MIDFFNKVVHSFITQNIHKVVTIISSIIIARTLGPAGKGEYALIIYVNMIMLSLIGVGLANAQIYLKRKYSLNTVTSNVLFLGFLVTIVAIVLLIPIVHGLKDIVFKEVNLKYIFYVIFLLPVQITSLSLKRAFQSDYKIQTYNLLQLLQPILFLIFLVGFVFVIDMSVLVVITAWAVSIFTNNIFTCIIVAAKSNMRLHRVKLSIVKEILVYAVKYSFGGLIGIFQYRIDVFIVSFLLDIRAVGLYATGMAVAEIIWRIPASIVNVLQPWVANATDDEADNATPKVFRITAIIVFCLGVIIFFSAKWWIVLLYGTDFIYSAVILRWIIPGVFFISLWKILINDMNARGYPLYYGLSALTGVVIMIFLDFIFIPSMGLIGAAWACSIAYMVTFIVMIVFYMKQTSTKFTLFLSGKSDIVELFRNLQLFFNSKKKNL